MKIKGLAINIGVAVAAFAMLFIVTEVILRLYAGIVFVYKKASFSPQTNADVCGFNQFQKQVSGIFQPSNNPDLGVELKPGAVIDSGLSGIRGELWLKVNQRGLREDREYAIPKPPDVVRIAVLGDSVAFGWGQDLAASYSKILERKLQSFTAQSGSNKKIEVLNFGVPGYNGKQKIIVFKDKVLPYQPDLVIMSWLIDDTGHPAYLLGLPLIPNSVTKFLNGHSYLFSCFRERVLKKVYELNARPYKEQYQEDSEGWNESKKMFKEISGVSKRGGVPVLMVMLPVWQSFDKNTADGIASIHEFLDKTAKENGLDYADILPYLKNVTTIPDYVAAKGDLYHPNYNGHEMIADAIYTKITGEKPPPDPIFPLSPFLFKK
ncbi:MAG: SGNH/GDSL hydrolase family protein [Candidatus Liptonbacteria bacterium]|nr:SGNH/GDSL hydrolase family protein [Parcubacteria group bacterium]MBI4087360.1 SGNH/GDSL hydrolase family protein [Candidatus Liptonbacteria bacterium]